MEVCDLIDSCPARCGLIKAVFLEVEEECRRCRQRFGDGDCPESCLCHKLLLLVPAGFEFKGE